MGIGATQVAPLDANAGFSQNVSVSLGSGGSYGDNSSWQNATQGTATPSKTDDTTPNWTVIGLIVAVAAYIFFRK